MEEILDRGDADALSGILRTGLDPNTDVCIRYDAPEWTSNFPFRLLPYSALPKVCDDKSPLIVETVRSVTGPNAQNVVAELLRRGVDINTQSARGETALWVAVKNHDLDMLRFLLAHGAQFTADEKQEALLEAVKYTNAQMARLLIGRGANINHSFRDGSTPLIAAVQNESFPCVELLLQNGAAPNARDANGVTALGYALSANYGNRKAREIRLLLRHGASLFIKDKQRLMPLDRLAIVEDFHKATGQTAKIPSIWIGGVPLAPLGAPPPSIGGPPPP